MSGLIKKIAFFIVKRDKKNKLRKSIFYIFLINSKQEMLM